MQKKINKKSNGAHVSLKKQYKIQTKSMTGTWKEEIKKKKTKREQTQHAKNVS